MIGYESCLTESTPDNADYFDANSDDERDARYSLYDAREPCSCIPPLSSVGGSSMIYDQVSVGGSSMIYDQVNVKVIAEIYDCLFITIIGDVTT